MVAPTREGCQRTARLPETPHAPVVRPRGPPLKTPGLLGDEIPASPAAGARHNSQDLRHLIRRQHKALPVVMLNKGHRKAVAATVQTPEWKRAYRMRTGIERLFGRLKSHRRLDSVTVRGRYKVTVHSLLPMIVAQAWALAVPESPRQLMRAA